MATPNPYPLTPGRLIHTYRQVRVSPRIVTGFGCCAKGGSPVLVVTELAESVGEPSGAVVPTILDVAY